MSNGGWMYDGKETYFHAHCGSIRVIDAQYDGKPTCYEWTDRKGTVRGVFDSLQRAKLIARKLSGVQRWIEI